MTMTSSWLKLTSQTAVITGAASGIGRGPYFISFLWHLFARTGDSKLMPFFTLAAYSPAATAIAFAEQGCNILLADTDSQQTKLEEVVSACYDAAAAVGSNNNNNLSIRPHVCNVTNRQHIQTTILAADAMGSNNSAASILVNCAGITRDGRLANITDEDWDKVLDVNLKGTFSMCQEFCVPTRLSKLLGGKGSSRGTGGSIINIGSVISNYGNVGQVNYAASKGGVVGLTRAIAKEMALFSWKATSAMEDIAGHNRDANEELGSSAAPPTIRVNCIQPGMIVIVVCCFYSNASPGLTFCLALCL